MIVTNIIDRVQQSRHSTGSQGASANNFQSLLEKAKAAGSNIALTPPPAEVKSPAQIAFDEYMSKTPAQRMRDAILKEMGLTEESLSALPPEERKQVEEAITAKIKERLQAQAGNPDKSGSGGPQTLGLSLV